MENPVNTNDLENTVIITLATGEVHIELLPDVAPLHCERMKLLVRAGDYNNVCFHRVIDGFMAQTGDVSNGNMEKNFNIRMAGTGGSEHPNLPAEFSKLPHSRGTIGAARSQSPDSANSQFFINFKDNDFWITSFENNIEAKDWYAIDLKGRSVLIFGGEGSGISKQVLKNSDFLATIPMSHEMNSLNVATAVSAIVFERLRQVLS